jgi:N6-adenosine-specific RNA methylase IME4/ParB-like chromosome segregation protein Spo0J
MTQDAELTLIRIDLIDDHPDNPRLVRRQDVIDAIAASLDVEYPREHAISVRPLDGRFQITSGHHRKAAAIKAGLADIWCWVRELDDAAAHMELATANNQGEMDGLEIGIHALQQVPLSKGGRGEAGGLSAYARQIGKQRQHVSSYRQAATVFRQITSKGAPRGAPLSESADISPESLLGRSRHLAAIHSLPDGAWLPAVQYMLDKKLSLVNVIKAVQQAVDGWQSVKASPLIDLFQEAETAAAIFSGKLRHQQVNQILRLVEKVHADLIDHADLQKDWLLWLDANRGGDAWVFSKVQEKRAGLEEVAMSRDEEPIDDSRYDVIVVDPPWPMEKIDRDVAPNQVGMDYPVMSLEAIEEFSVVQDVAAADCHLFMWTTQKFLPAAISTVAAWGFRYVLTMVWHKPGGFQPFGLPQYNCEFCIYARLGKPEFADTKAFNCCFSAPRGGHSEKPEEFYDLIRRVTPGRRLDVFNRREIEGFTGWGHESV